MPKRKLSFEYKCDDKLLDLVLYINDELLISFVLSFLSQSEIQAYSYSCKSNRNLTLRCGLIHYNLNRSASINYYHSGLGEINTELSEKIRNQMFLGARITGLDLSGILYRILDENILGSNLEKLDVTSYVGDISNLGYVRELRCQMYRWGTDMFLDVSPLSKVHKLTIEGRDFEFSPMSQMYMNLKGIESFSNVHELYLKHCIIPDLSLLAKIHTLTLSDVKDSNGDIRDVSMLSSVHTLTLENLPELADVTSLGTIKDLHLKKCNKITNLCKQNPDYEEENVFVHKVTLTECEGIIYLGDLSNVCDLTLDSCYNIDEDLYLSSAAKLTLKRYEIAGYLLLYALNTWDRALENLLDLTLDSCFIGAECLNVCTSFPKLTLINCTGLPWSEDGKYTTFKNFYSVNDITIDSCPDFRFVYQLPRVDKLTLRNCVSITEVSILKSIKDLSLDNCQNIRDISSVLKAPKISIKNCGPNPSFVINRINIPQCHVCLGKRFFILKLFINTMHLTMQI